MAKISANGAVEVARWRNPNGALYLMRSDGVLLRKSGVPGDGWKRSGKGILGDTVAQVDEAMARMGYARVK